MIRRLHQSLPGPLAVRTALLVVIAVAALAVLVLFYEWVGAVFLDSGGTIG